MAIYPYFTASLPHLVFKPEQSTSDVISVEKLCLEAKELMSVQDWRLLAYIFAPTYNSIYVKKILNEGIEDVKLDFEPSCIIDEIESLPFMQKFAAIVNDIKGGESGDEDGRLLTEDRLLSKAWPLFYEDLSGGRWQKLGIQRGGFLQKYFTFDCQWRLVQRFWLHKKFPRFEQKEILFENPKLVELEQIMQEHLQNKDLGLTVEWEYASDFFRIMEEEDILRREILTDKLRWDFAEEWGGDTSCNSDYLWAYFVKLQIYARWRKLHSTHGAEILRKKVDELKNIEWNTL